MDVKLDLEDRTEVLRYLGYRGTDITDTVNEDLNHAISLCNDVARINSVFKYFKIERLNEGLLLAGSTILLPKGSADRWLEGCAEMVLFSVTLGLEFDRQVDRLMVTDGALGVCLNSAGVTLLEKAADNLQLEMDERLKPKKTGTRFSPGYGALPLSLQEDILKELKAEKILGIKLNENNLMSPLKSITCMAGVK